MENPVPRPHCSSHLRVGVVEDAYSHIEDHGLQQVVINIRFPAYGTQAFAPCASKDAPLTANLCKALGIEKVEDLIGKLVVGAWDSLVHNSMIRGIIVGPDRQFFWLADVVEPSREAVEAHKSHIEFLKRETWLYERRLAEMNVIDWRLDEHREALKQIVPRLLAVPHSDEAVP
jgi:hypothetical protein